MRYFRLVKVAIFFTALVTLSNANAGSDFKADPSKILPYTFDLEETEWASYGTLGDDGKTYGEPYVASFKVFDKEVLFVPLGYSFNSKHPIFDLIRKIFKDYKPDIVLSGDFLESDSATTISQKCSNACSKNNDLQQHCVDSYFGIVTAEHARIPIQGTRANSARLLQHMEEHGFTVDDIVGEHIILRLTHEMRKKLEPNTSSEQVDVKSAAVSVIENAKKDNTFGKTTLTYEGFLDWYRKNFGKEFVLSDITPNHPAPIGNDSEALYSQKISYESSRINEIALLKHIENALQNPNIKRVLVFAGGSRFLVQRPAIEDMMGVVAKKITL